MSEVVVKPLSAEVLADYLEFFDRGAFTDNPHWAGCYCFFPYHDPQDGNWSQRTAEQNRAAVIRGIESGTASGFLAYVGTQVVGWCNAAPRSAYPTLRNLPGDAAATGATPCFIVDPQWRNKGVAAQLLAAACAALREQGMRLMEAAPSRGAQTAAQHSRGPLAMYVSSGYQVVNEFPDGTVVVAKVL